MIELQIIGLQALRDRFRRLSRNARSGLLRRDLEAAADRMAPEARRLAPKRTGELRASIKTRPARSGGRRAAVVHLIVEARHAAPVEFGVRRGRRQRPQPFIRPTLRKRGRESARRIARAFQKRFLRS